MNQIRRNIIKRVFYLLDKEGTGNLSIKTLKENFNASNHPLVKSKQKYKEDVENEFFDTIDDYYLYLVHKYLYKLFIIYRKKEKRMDI